ncbi:MAG: helix-turn-helix domain-containing protein [Opitutae bacterium]|nr:helix-turn-helix domain-containing protein [Opitutae bacterium]
MADEFSLARLAEQAELSEFHFTRLFKRATGVPPLQYQIKLRMEAARRLLRETDKSLLVSAQVEHRADSTPGRKALAGLMQSRSR